MVHREHPDSIAGRIAIGAAIGVGGVVAIAAAAAAVVTVAFARTVVTPPRKREEDTRILAHDEATITLSATLDSLTPGRYSFWFRQDTGHARVGEILSHTSGTVTRELLGVQFGQLGAAPAWLVPSRGRSSRWMIGVHGRAVRRQETLRSVPVFREAGYTSLLVSYRNDGDAPRSPDHRYALGDSEWRDIEAAMRYAIEHGAKHIVLMGWSMGGATVLQALTRSPLAEHVSGVVLDSPVVDWVTALEYQGVANRLPKPIQWGVIRLLTKPWAGLITGQREPIDLERLDIVRRADELHTPILLLHSDDDGYVPSTASRALAVARPDIVTFEPFEIARHTKLWNYDEPRWNAVIARFLDRLP
jgi:alpha-beta hydrolase superfamily lysophospholipase